ncbi:MAG: hypothetical protein ACRDQ5_13230 [Sciscionella sp.]
MVQASAVHGGVHLHSAAVGACPVPRQLPAAPAWLADREDDRVALDESVRRAAGRAGVPAVVVLYGPDGVGKSALGLRWLSGGSGGVRVVSWMRPAATAARVRRWPSGTSSPGSCGRGTSPPRRSHPRPSSVRRCSGSLTARRSVALLLDDAVSSAQVRALLPAHAHTLGVITSRWPLPTLSIDGALAVAVAPLQQRPALRLLAHHIGADRVAAEQEDAVELTRAVRRVAPGACVRSAPASPPAPTGPSPVPWPSCATPAAACPYSVWRSCL